MILNDNSIEKEFDSINHNLLISILTIAVKTNVSLPGLNYY